MSTYPTPSDRNRARDLITLSTKVVQSRCSFGAANELTDRVVESPDLLVFWVSRALGVEFKVDWKNLDDETELPVVRAWEEYCCDLFDDVERCVLEALAAVEQIHNLAEQVRRSGSVSD